MELLYMLEILTVQLHAFGGGTTAYAQRVPAEQILDASFRWRNCGMYVPANI